MEPVILRTHQIRILVFSKTKKMLLLSASAVLHGKGNYLGPLADAESRRYKYASAENNLENSHVPSQLQLNHFPASTISS